MSFVESPVIVDEVRTTSGSLMQYVLDDFRDEGRDLGGWHHHLGAHKISALGTGLGIGIVARICPADSRQLQRALRFLQTKQNEDGGFGIETVERATLSLVESSSYIALSLIGLIAESKGGYECGMASSILAGITSYLIKSRNPGSGWGSTCGDSSKVFSTAIAVQALSRCAGLPFEGEARDIFTEEDRLSAANRGSEWLLEASNGPAWGPIPNASPTAFHTAVAIVAVRSSQEDHAQEKLERSQKWLLEAWHPWRQWEHQSQIGNLVEMFDIPSMGDSSVYSRATWSHSPTAWCLLALCTDPIHRTTLPLVSAGRWLMRQSNDQSIAVLREPRPAIWAVWDAVQALTRLHDHLLEAGRSSRPWHLLSWYLVLLIRRTTRKYALRLVLLISSVAVVLGYLAGKISSNWLFGLFIPVLLIIVDEVRKRRQ